jgi:hypothetical protein
MDELLQLSPEQLARLVSLARSAENQQSAQGPPPLPTEILGDLDGYSTKELSTFTQKFGKQLPTYDGTTWTRQGAVNKGFLPDLKKHNIDALQLVQQQHKDGGRLRTAARAATSLYEQLIAYGDRKDEEDPILSDIIENARLLAVFGYATGKTIDNEAKAITTKALHLPVAVQHLEGCDDDDDKDFIFSPSEYQAIHEARYNQQLLRQGSSSNSNNNNNFRRGFSGNHRGHQQQQRWGRGNFSRGSNQRGNFFGRGHNQSSNQSQPPTHNHQSSQPSNQSQ